MKYLLIICLILAGCETNPPSVVVTPTGPATAAQIAAQQATIDELKAKDAALTQASQNAAGGVWGGIEANTYNPDGLPKEAVAAQLAEAASALPEPTADQKLEKANQNARILAGELAAVKTEMGQAITENQALRAKVDAADARVAAAEAAQSKAEAAAVREREQAAAKLQAQFASMTKQIQAAKDEARKAALQRLGYVLLGLGAILTLAGAAIAFVTKGLEWERSAIAATFGGLCFSLYWSMNQWWFKWLVIGVVVLGVAAGVWWLIRERKITVRQNEADEAEDTLKRVIAAVDKLGDGATVAQVKAAMGDLMNDNNKALVHELRAETKRTTT